MRFRIRDSTDPDTQKTALIVAIAMVVIAFALAIWLAANGIFGKLWIVVWSNQAYPLILVLLIGFGGYWKLREKQEFTWGELGIYCLLCPLISYPFAATAYYFCTDLHDREVWNGYVVKAVYTESWTERITTTDSKGRTTTTYVFHPATYVLTTSNDGETVSVSWPKYREVAKLFGTEKFEAVIRLNRSSIGDGNRYVAAWNGKPEAKIPTAVEHHYVNYLKASDSVLRVRGATSGFEDLLKPYPRVHDGPHGRICIDRLVCAGTSPPEAWMQAVNRRLCEELMELGKRKEVNILVYVVGTEDESFFYALQEYWISGKQNDVIVVIGTDEFPKIRWVRVMAWTSNELFKELLADRIRGMKTIENGDALVSNIVTQVAVDGNEGFLRRPMDEYEYLVAFIGLPWWGVVLLIVLVTALMSPVIWWFCINDWFVTH